MRGSAFVIWGGICILLFVVAAVGAEFQLRCNVRVPKQYRAAHFKSPNGQPEPVRYTVAYGAFWWNCVAVRAGDLQARCPFLASGTPATAAGAADGALNADKQIESLLKD